MFSRELFGQRLLEIRKQNHETQPDLAQLLNVSKSRISEMENGKNTITFVPLKEADKDKTVYFWVEIEK